MEIEIVWALTTSWTVLDIRVTDFEGNVRKLVVGWVIGKEVRRVS